MNRTLIQKSTVDAFGKIFIIYSLKDKIISLMFMDFVKREVQGVGRSAIGVAGANASVEGLAAAGKRLTT